MVWAKTWSKKPKKGTSYAKFSRNRSNFKKTDWNKVSVNKKPVFKPNPPKKTDWLDGVWEVDFTTNITTYYSPQEWKKKEAELSKQTLESSILAAKQQSVRKAPFKTKGQSL